jgi:hypothetical protein
MTFTPIEKQCEACGKVFEVGGRGRPMKTQRFCSDPCKLKGRYRRGLVCAALSPTEAAYIAGLIDGEGSVMLIKRGSGGGCQLRVVVSNTHEGVLRWLSAVTGIGKTYRLIAATERHKAGFSWRAHGDGAQTLLQQIRPYLIIKAEQADLGIEAHERLKVASFKVDLSWQEEWKIRMKKMNARGPQSTYSMTAGAGG